MWRFVFVLGLLLLSAAPVAAQSNSPVSRVTQIDSSRYPEIALSVSVKDAAGNSVQGLNAQDFHITEDGVPVDVAAFAGGGAPIAAALVIDRSGSMKQSGKLEGAQAAANAFVEQLRSSDEAALLAFAERPELVEGFTSDHATLQRAVSRLRADGSTALYDSIVAGVEELNTLQGRRALLVLTDGRDRRSVEDSTPASMHSLEEAIQTAQTAGISVQVIGLGDRASDDLMDGIDESVLQRIADETGGQYFYAPTADKLAELYASLATSMQQEYHLIYRSPRPFYDGTRRDIHVTVAGAAAAGGYVEPHLIQVRSNPWVALALLIPLVGLLVAPRFVRRNRSEVIVVQPQQAARPVAEASNTMPQTPSFCDQCGSKLRPGSRFCAGCGARIIAPPSDEVQR